MYKNKNAYITVYLSLCIGILLSFLLTMIEGVRYKTIKFQSECVTDIGLNSIFAEYNRQMLEQYDLLFIDSSYGNNSGTSELTKSHLLQYLNINFHPPEQENIALFKDLTALHADNVTLNKISYASDNGGDVLRYQILQYMKEKSGLDMIENVFGDNVSKDTEYDDYNNRRSQTNDSIDGMIEMINAEKEENEEKVSISNPADSVEELSQSSVLNYAINNINDISKENVYLDEFISHRSYNEGFGLSTEQVISNNPLNKTLYYTLYYTYIFNKCAYYRKEKQNSKLKYQIEYLLYGKDSDMKNLELVAEKIFKLRYVINMAYLFSDGSKQMEAEELAILVTTGLMHPELTEAVKISILFAWGYAETAKDLRILFDGKKLEAIKSSYGWNTPLSQMITFKSHLGEYKASSTGLNYENYLSAFLFIMDQKTVNSRLMDIMEMDVRNTAGNHFFQLDKCIYQLEADINISSAYGYGVNIKRWFSYE